MALSARHVFVSGRVQGVGFRWHARERAAGLGLAGWVKNTPDGRVEAWLEGETAALEAMLAWLRRGPSAARVSGLEVLESPCAGLSSFSVRG